MQVAHAASERRATLAPLDDTNQLRRPMLVRRAVAPPARVVHVTQSMPERHTGDTARYAASSRAAARFDRAVSDRLVVAGATALAGPGGALVAIDTGHSPNSICARLPRMRCERCEVSDRQRIVAS